MGLATVRRQCRWRDADSCGSGSWGRYPAAG